MKASWVITDEERQERNRIKTTSSSNVNINNNLGGGCYPSSNTSSTSDDSEENDNHISSSGSGSRNHQHLLPLLTETELQFIDNLVTKSGFFESSMIADLNVHLARQIVRLWLINNIVVLNWIPLNCRMVAFHARLDYLSQNLLKEVFVRRTQVFAHSLVDLAKLDSKDRTQVRRSQSQPHLAQCVNTSLWCRWKAQLKSNHAEDNLNKKGLKQWGINEAIEWEWHIRALIRGISNEEF